MAVRVSVVNPVIFTDGAGPDGADELHAPYFPDNEQHQVKHGAGAFPIAVWCTLADNIPDSRAIHSILVVGWDSEVVNLQVSGQPGQQGRIRINVLSLFEV